LKTQAKGQNLPAAFISGIGADTHVNDQAKADAIPPTNMQQCCSPKKNKNK
jgi:hypothetical protein